MPLFNVAWLRSTLLGFGRFVPSPGFRFLLLTVVFTLLSFTGTVCVFLLEESVPVLPEHDGEPGAGPIPPVPASQGHRVGSVPWAKALPAPPQGCLPGPSSLGAVDRQDCFSGFFPAGLSLLVSPLFFWLLLCPLSSLW